jgi:hypothetical protein
MPPEILTAIDTTELQRTVAWTYYHLVADLGYDPATSDDCCGRSADDDEHDLDCWKSAWRC